MAVVKLKSRKTETNDEEAVVLSPMDRPIRRPWIALKTLLALGGVATTLVLAAYAYLNFGLTRSVDVDAVRVTISQVRTGTFGDTIPLTGTIAPKETVYLDSIEGGKITAVLVEEGAMVEAGQILVRLKNTNLQLDVVGREAQYAEQISNLANARLSFRQNALRHKRDLIDTQYQIDTISAQLKRKKPLLATGAVPAAEVEDLEVQLAYQKDLSAAIIEAQETDEELQKTQIAQLEQSIESMSQTLMLVRENLDSLSITAPIAGQLTTLDAHLGEAVARGRRIGQIDQLSGHKIAASVDEFYVGRVRVGQKAIVDINDRSYPLVVSKVYPDVRNRKFDIDLAFSKSPAEGMRRGQTVQLSLELGEAVTSLILDNGSFFDETGGQWVFVLAPDGTDATRRNVTLGRRNGQMIEVIAGLTEGERVIISTYSSYKNIDHIAFRNGSPVTPSSPNVSTEEKE